MIPCGAEAPIRPTLPALALALSALAACDRWAPGNPVEGVAVLQGAHATAPCAACHDVAAPFTAEVITCNGLEVLPGTGLDSGDTAVPAVDWTAQCLECHECNRPQAGDTVCGETIGTPHYGTASCGATGCHGFADDEWNQNDKCDGGTTTVPNTCQTCHESTLGGDFGNDGAPVGGSHAAHLTTTIDTVPDGAGGFDPYSCDVCHPDGGFGAATHQDGTLNLVLDAGGTTFGTYDGASGSCTVSCHGSPSTLTYSAPATLPVWDVALDGCATCHGSPPIAPHVQVNTCAGCHAPTGGADPTTVVGVDAHIDGTFQCTAGNCP